MRSFRAACSTRPGNTAKRSALKRRDIGARPHKADDYDMEEFPAKYIVNKDLLNRHVENQFYSADPIRYKEVVIKQKVDDAVNRNIRRAYIRNMYTNQFGKL
mgnify:CR=1 FL=1